MHCQCLHYLSYPTQSQPAHFSAELQIAAGKNAFIQETPPSPHHASSLLPEWVVLLCFFFLRMTHNTLTEVPTLFDTVEIDPLSTRNILPYTPYGHICLFRNLYINNLFPPWNVQALFILNFRWCDTILHWKLLVPKWITWYLLLGNVFAASLPGVKAFSVISFSSPELLLTEHQARITCGNPEQGQSQFALPIQIQQLLIISQHLPLNQYFIHF